LQFARDPKADVAITGIARQLRRGQAQGHGAARAVGSTAHDSQATRRRLARTVAAVGHPLPDIAEQIGQSQRASRKRAGRRQPTTVPRSAAAVTIGVNRPPLLPGTVEAPAFRERDFEPLLFGGQSVQVARDATEPPRVLTGIKPADVGDRQTSALTRSGPWPAAAAPGTKTGVKFGERYFVHAHGQVWCSFGATTCWPRNHPHQRTILAVPEWTGTHDELGRFLARR